MFLPFLAALSALFGGVEKKTGKDPKAIKQAKIQNRKRRQKQVKKGGRWTSRIKEYAAGGAKLRKTPQRQRRADFQKVCQNEKSSESTAYKGMAYIA